MRAQENAANRETEQRIDGGNKRIWLRHGAYVGWIGALVAVTTTVVIIGGSEPVSALSLTDGGLIGLFDGFWSPTAAGRLWGRMAVSASSRRAAAPLRYAPSGDPLPSIRQSTAMAVRPASGHGLNTRRNAAMHEDGWCYPLPLPSSP